MEREIAKLFKQAWSSNSFAECPSFAQWYDVFHSARERIKIDAERQSAEEHSLLYQNVWKLQDY